MKKMSAGGKFGKSGGGPNPKSSKLLYTPSNAASMAKKGK